MTISTTETQQLAETLGAGDRATFDVAYDPWTALDAIDGAPSHTDHLKDRTSLLGAVLGAETAQAFYARANESLDKGDLATYDKLDDEAEAVYAAYTAAFGPLPK